MSDRDMCPKCGHPKVAHTETHGCTVWVRYYGGNYETTCQCYQSFEEAA